MTAIRTRGIRGIRTIRLKGGRGGGSSLLEVLIALSLLATSILGAASAQLAALRNAKAQIDREQASWVAASVAEAMRSPEALSHALMRFRARTAMRLSGAQITVNDEAPGAGVVVVIWAHGSGASAREPGLGPDSCPVAEGGTLANCIALPFASGK